MGGVINSPGSLLCAFYFISSIATDGCAEENTLKLRRSLGSTFESTLSALEKNTKLPRNAISSRIIGGTVAAAGSYPYMAQGSGGCGASLIAPDMLLTAAHCDSAFRGDIRIGSVVSLPETESAGGAMVQAQWQLAHPDFQENTLAYDFMIIKLNREVHQADDSDANGTQIYSVQLNTDDMSPYVNEPLTVMGFGDTAEGGTASELLREVSIPYVRHGDCNRLYGDIDETSMLCAGGVTRDSCQGDSGGPILNSAGLQVGVVSFGIGCARPGIPGVYARVSGAIDWINHMICDHSPSYCPNNDDGGELPIIEGNDDDDRVRIRVRVIHDEYPWEVSWTLRSSEGKLVLSQSANEVNNVNADVSRFTMVTPGNYTMKINDDFADGICCGYGTGRIEIYAGDDVVAHRDGIYEESAVIEFTVPSALTFNSSNSGSDELAANLTFMVDVQYDSQPEDFWWWIRDDKTKKIAGRKGGSITEPGILIREALPLVPGERYRVNMRDRNGDGTNGFLEIYVLVDNVRVRLMYCDGAFEYQRDTRFTVPTDLVDQINRVDIFEGNR